MTITHDENGVTLHDVACFDLALTLDCGQAFRWHENADGSWSGVAADHPLTLSANNGDITLHGVSIEEYEDFWAHYFALDMDYDDICARLRHDPQIAPAVDEYYGIRLLNQDRWEALCSFVISQQNNIKRIKRLVEALCTAYGTPLADGVYAFPTAEQLSQASEDELRALGLGYRAEYIVLLAQSVANGDIDLAVINALPTDRARAELLKIRGVGNKVANCALLFGMGYYDCVPVDTWISKALRYYPDGLPDCFRGIEGIAQQYLFHWARNNL